MINDTLPVCRRHDSPKKGLSRVPMVRLGIHPKLTSRSHVLCLVFFKTIDTPHMACSFGVTQPTLKTAHMVCTSQASRGDLRLILRLALSVYDMESDSYYARFGRATSQLLDLSDASGGVW
jgi:hypothetical protein